MNPKSLPAALGLVASLMATHALAHDPSLHEMVPAEKAKPLTCEELADTERYSPELADKELKANCEAKAQEAEADAAQADGKRG